MKFSRQKTDDIQHVGSHDIERGLLPFSARRTLCWRACCRTLRRLVRRPAPLEMLLEAHDLYDIHSQRSSTLDTGPGTREIKLSPDYSQISVSVLGIPSHPSCRSAVMVMLLPYIPRDACILGPRFVMAPHRPDKLRSSLRRNCVFAILPSLSLTPFCASAYRTSCHYSIFTYSAFS